MQFYKIEGLVKAAVTIRNQNNQKVSREDQAEYIGIKSSVFNSDFKKDAFFFVSTLSRQSAIIGIIARSQIDVKNSVSAFLQEIGLVLSQCKTEEVTYGTLEYLLSAADHRGFIDNEDMIKKKYNLDYLEDWHSDVKFTEKMIDTDEKPKQVFAKAERLLVSNSLLPEMERICEGQNNKRFSGHPVQYLIRTNDREVCDDTYRILLQTLYGMGRLQNKRYCYSNIQGDMEINLRFFDQLYGSNQGGAIIIQYDHKNKSELDLAHSGVENTEIICDYMKRFRHQVLTILCLPRECVKVRDAFFEHLGDMTLVEIEESFAKDEVAVNLLKQMAKEDCVRIDKDLLRRIEPGEGYLTVDLRNIYDEWYNGKLKTKIFPQYKEMETISRKVQKAGYKGNAYEELMNMIGLEEAKKIIDRAIKYRKAQVLFADKGMQEDHPSMHMVFSGSPGTAKTTVARLFARIMKDNGLLSIGHLVEVGRGDLVGRFVGWTANIVQEKFREAKGGVLFIDEAYSLVDDRNGSYGDEAINTIVQEMENNRDELVVIFAGYTDKMEAFLNKNPGLRSRIAYHVPFPDYSTKELCEIAAHTAAQKGITLSEDVQEKLVKVFDLAKTQPDFGNGRFVRNILEKARMAQAERLLDMDLDKVTRKNVSTICAEDIELPDIKKSERRPIGFL